ncbi:polyprenyl diphosphate synthase [Caulobacter segnis]|uniref:polyprenyl diphosphate synthase n=1 Tax=Caulobacter segnis TaxID=88688 RepID=UPI00240F5CBB|nr:polyprenyl diphosphate synthase [Caulobacter segnis]MDG2522024.1 polyprenyl diphosphate synthase [Caulobacter segnis]
MTMTGQQSEARPADAGTAPLHVAIIMDGNGRWAKRRGLPRTFGHREGVKALKRTVEGAAAVGVGRLTVFGFSTENWRRPAAEVSELMGLLKAYVSSDLERLAKEGVRVTILGRREGLSPDVLEVIERAERRTAENTAFHLQVAFNYGGQADIVDAARKFAKAVEEGRAKASDLDEALFERSLSTADAPPPDLIVRTSGERRLSNFLLWEGAYAELVFQDVLWPDYGPEHLKAAIAEFATRERRYGGAMVDDVLAAG